MASFWRQRKDLGKTLMCCSLEYNWSIRWDFLKLNIHVIILWSSSSAPRCTPTRTDGLCSQKVCIWSHSPQMDRLWFICTLEYIQFWESEPSDTCHSICKSRTNTKWKKPNCYKEHIMWFHLCGVLKWAILIYVNRDTNVGNLGRGFIECENIRDLLGCWKCSIMQGLLYGHIHM